MAFGEPSDAKSILVIPSLHSTACIDLKSDSSRPYSSKSPAPCPRLLVNTVRFLTLPSPIKARDPLILDNPIFQLSYINVYCMCICIYIYMST